MGRTTRGCFSSNAALIGTNLINTTHTHEVRRARFPAGIAFAH